MKHDAPHEHRAHAPRVLGFAVLALSDTRDLAHDESGALLADAIVRAGHRLVWRDVARDEPRQIRDALEAALGEAGVDVLLCTGGTGLSPRDVTPDTLVPLFEKRIPGFGELFRVLSHHEVGSAAMLSRADAGIIRDRPVFLLPGSPKACRLAWEKLILPEAAHLVGVLRPQTRQP